VSRYISEQDGAWRLWFRSDLWNGEIWQAVRQLIAAGRPDKHPRTVEIRVAGAQQAFVKIFFASSLPGAFKDCFRCSKAVHTLLIAESLMEAGFNVPVAICAGEERYAKVLRRSFLVSLAVEGCSLPDFLCDQFNALTRALPLRRKHEMLRQLAREIRRFHDQGFVHGDLVPGNIFVALDGHGLARFCFMDNDRTRRYPTWLGHRLWRRNLVQLNRFPLAGISLQDRMRFFHAYVNLRKIESEERKLLRWLEEKTRQRRRECDAVDASGSFRKLMRWEATRIESENFEL
jgi:Lipopolysaccharide kinase (Kdo/WaaP) family